MNESVGRVLAALEAAPQGLTRYQLQQQPGLTQLEVQPLVRILRGLVEGGRVRIEGNTRARRYFAATSSGLPKPGRSADEDGVPLSPEGRADLDLLARPLSARRPVAYQRGFLDAYRAGETEYLPLALRQHLASLGRTNALDQPAGTYARTVLQRFLIDLTWNSARLEGNTYSLLDTERLLAEGTSAEGKNLRETQMILNHKAAIEYLVAVPAAPTLDVHTVKTLNALLMENLLGDRLDEGRLRSIPVQISGSAYIPLATPQLIEECFRQIIYTTDAIADPFEKAFFLLVQLPYLQPFVDGNKRTARLAANVPFIQGNLVPLSFADVPRDLFVRANLAVYELNHVDLLRDLFVWAYERSAARLGQVRSSLGEPDPFRLKYRALLREVVVEMVRARPLKSKLKKRITAFARERLPKAEQPRFLSMAEIELESLHDGNFSRYGLRPSEFEAWVSSRG